MEKDIYLKDYLVSRIITQGKEIEGYYPVYYKTNENLVTYFDKETFEDKKVLSVLASSDQLFSARYLGAKTVDTFDMNRLTMYYYYLRKWSIKYLHELYPLVLSDNKWLEHLLKLVKPESEMEYRSLLFFRKHLKNNTRFENLFYRDYETMIGKTVFSNPEELIPRIDEELTFFEYNLFRDISSKARYDIILISNILDWARGDRVKLNIAKNNLSRLLNDNGIVIGSRLVNRTEESIDTEESIFKKEFSKEEQGRSIVYRKIK